MKGRKRTPANLRMLRGNPGKRPEPKQETQPKGTLPNPPAHLSAEAKREWWRMGRRLVRLGLMTEIDKAALAAYCQAWARWADAEKKLEDDGPVTETASGFPTQSVYLQIANRAMEQMLKCLVEFGMTPSSRSRVHAPAGAAEKDEIEEWKSGRKRSG